MKNKKMKKLLNLYKFKTIFLSSNKETNYKIQEKGFFIGKPININNLVFDWKIKMDENDRNKDLAVIKFKYK
ncbi:MAG: hypothetical protein SPLM_05560 [Spiroplasma phoeniceum]|uniref:hypothetical protein n=1 Tax=Spiroplasma phoeniceum TaxID=47835 RepID=UPI00326A5E24